MGFVNPSREHARRFAERAAARGTDRTFRVLDAGAGSAWRYREDASGRSFRRSEGLGVASWHAFCAGLFSGDPDRPLQADAAGLAALTVEDVTTAVIR